MLSGNTIEQVIYNQDEFIDIKQFDGMMIAEGVGISFDLTNKRVIFTHWVNKGYIRNDWVLSKQVVYSAKEETECLDWKTPPAKIIGTIKGRAKFVGKAPMLPYEIDEE